MPSGVGGALSDGRPYPYILSWASGSFSGARDIDKALCPSVPLVGLDIICSTDLIVLQRHMKKVLLSGLR